MVYFKDEEFIYLRKISSYTVLKLFGRIQLFLAYSQYIYLKVTGESFLFLFESKQESDLFERRQSFDFILNLSKEMPNYYSFFSPSTNHSTYFPKNAQSRRDHPWMECYTGNSMLNYNYGHIQDQEYTKHGQLKWLSEVDICKIMSKLATKSSYFFPHIGPKYLHEGEKKIKNKK